MSKHVVLVADPDARARLKAVAALRGSFEVTTLDAGEEIVRGVRRLRPDLVLLAMPRARMNEALRSCRTVKTDGGHPPIVGLVDRWRRVTDADNTLAACKADGYLGGKAEADDFLAFALSLDAGERPVYLLEAELGLLGRIIRTNTLR